METIEISDRMCRRQSWKQTSKKSRWNPGNYRKYRRITGLPDHHMWTWFAYRDRCTQSQNWDFQCGICHVCSHERENGFRSHKEHHYCLKVQKKKNIFKKSEFRDGLNTFFFVYLQRAIQWIKLNIDDKQVFMNLEKNHNRQKIKEVQISLQFGDFFI